MAITSQFNFKDGLKIVDDALYPVSMGKVSDTGMHIPDLDIIDGKNILPTQAGYTSYFGKDRNIDDTVLASLKVQEIITYRTKHGDVVQLAFTNAGLYLSSVGGSATAVRTYTASVPPVPAYITVDLPNGKGDWIWVFGSTLGHASPWELWTYVLIENDLYIYYKGLKHIYKLYSVESEQVLFDELDPSFIISTDKVWQFTINAEDRSEGDDTEKSVAISTDSGLYLGNYIHPVDKAHQVWNVEKLVLAPFHIGLPARLENFSRVKQDIDALITLSSLDLTTAIHANGAASELIVTIDNTTIPEFYPVNRYQDLQLTNLIPGGTITFTLNDPGVATCTIVILGSDTKADIITKVAAAVESMNSDPDAGVYELAVQYVEDQAVDKDEISLLFRIGSNVAGFGGSWTFENENYTGTGTVTIISSGEGGGDFYAYADAIKPKYRINILDNYTTFTEGEVATITLDDVDYNIIATASESATSVLARLRTLILTDSNHTELTLDVPDGSFTFTKEGILTWDVGGSRYAPITVSNNLQLTSTYWGNDEDYDPDWLATSTGYLVTTIRLQGFKEYGLTTLGVTLDDTDYTIPVSSIDDSNDIIDNIYDTIVLIDAAATLDVTDIAYAEADYDLVINVPIFDGSTPSPTLVQDGTTLWTVDGGATTSETVELLGVDGIFYARGRLGYWTYDNLEGWSAINDPMDFTPSTVTRANQISIKAVKGDIVKVIGYEDGFIIYATGNVIHAVYVKDSVNVFTFTPIAEAPGIIDPRHVTATSDTQYYWHNTGLYVVDVMRGAVKEQLGEISDWLNSYEHPIQIQVIGNRFLVFNLLNNNIQFSNRAIRNGGNTNTQAVDAFIGSPVEIESPAWGSNLYPTYKRGLMYDTKLQKWGTCDQDYLVLASLSPYNQSGYQADKDYKNTSQFLDNQQRGLLILGTDGKLWITNDNPADAYITFGHYAVHRTHRTKVIESHLEFVKAPDATIDFEPSLDWITIAWEYLKTLTITGLRASIFPNISAYWINATLRGRFHMKRGLIKGHQHGR